MSGKEPDAEGGGLGDEGRAGRASLRLCRIPPPSGVVVGASSCGFHISRTQWDPYPWVSAVELGSPAEAAGLRAGDCVLEVNGEDVLGRRIGEVAAKVRAGRDRLHLLVWNAGCDPGTAVTLTAGSGPTPLNLQLLSSCLQQASQLLECPVCLEAVSPPVWQCCHGHLLCSACRARSERCPLCRVALGPRGRSLLADKLHELLSQTHRRYNDQRNADAPRTPTATAADASEAGEHRAHVLTRGLRLAASSEDVSDGAVHPATPCTSATSATPGGRARSQSAGHIGATAATAATAPDKASSEWVHCPYGSACSTTCPADEVFNHLRDDHDGPLTQYFPRRGRALSLPMQQQQQDSLTALVTKAGDTLFLHAERGCMWLWAVAPSAADSVLRVAFPGDALRAAPVFPLSASSEDVIATGRCTRLPADRELHELRVSVRVEDA